MLDPPHPERRRSPDLRRRDRFIDPLKAHKLERSFDLPGRGAAPVKCPQIARVEHLGPMEVFDIQTESGEYLSDGLRNCFILSVDDSMDSILNWYREEGFIFKGGSGAGLNLSRIRSSKELLSWVAPLRPRLVHAGCSMQARERSSGGATRRAAKMVVLDVDHPDIEEFIETKAREENKIRRCGMPASTWTWVAATSPAQYQTPTTRCVTDEFMRVVEDAAILRCARTDGRVLETVNARELFDKMAKAAWECADPGIQYDDTINDWHTNPETGRITASNPCSEYMSLDNSLQPGQPQPAQVPTR